jgi:hypothetical protein
MPGLAPLQLRRPPARSAAQWRAVVALLLCAGAGSCGDRQTSLVVTVRSDLGSEVEEVLIEVQGRTARQQSLTPRFGVRGFEPVRVVLVPENAEDAEVVVTVSASGGGQRLVSQRARVSVLAGEVRTLGFFLARTCAAPVCERGETCYDGQCLPEQRERSSLPAYDDAIRPEVMAPPPPLDVVLIQPAGSVATNGDVEVRAEVTGGVPERVFLLVDDRARIDLTAPYAERWSTAGMPEGAHRLAVVAVREGRAHRSAARAVDIDRTPPYLEAIWPPDSVAVAHEGELTLTFSEPLRGAVAESFTVTGTPIKIDNDPHTRDVRFGYEVVGPARTLAVALFTLSDDRKSVVIIPDTIDITQSLLLAIEPKARELTDLAGNALQTLEPRAHWNMPAWLALGEGPIVTLAVDAMDMAQDEKGQPVLVWTETSPPALSGVALRWAAAEGWQERILESQWIRLAPLPASLLQNPRGRPSVAVDSEDRVVIALEDPDARAARVFRLADGAWSQVGKPLATSLGGIDLVAGHDATLFLALTDPDGKLRVARWTGQVWETIGSFDGDTRPMTPASGAAVAFDDDLSVSWQEGGALYAAVPEKWGPTRLTSARGAAALIASYGNALVAWVDQQGEAESVAVGWADASGLVLPLLAGRGARAISGEGSRISFLSGGLDPLDGSAVIAWRDQVSGRPAEVFIWHHEWRQDLGKFEWAPVGQPLGNRPVKQPVLNSQRLGMVVAWREDHIDGQERLFVTRRNMFGPHP